MRFEIGKFYRLGEPGGRVMHVVGRADTMQYGRCLVAEEPGYANLLPVGEDETAAQGWVETTSEEWTSGRRVGAAVNGTC